MTESEVLNCASSEAQNSTSTTELLVSFLDNNFGSEIQRIIIVDYLNVKIGSQNLYSSMSDVCRDLEMSYPRSPAIIVSKMEIGITDADYSCLAQNYPNIIIVITGTRPYIKNHVMAIGTECCEVAAYNRYLAEADDNMIALLTLVITYAGCASFIISKDRFRNCTEVFENIPKYKYKIYYKDKFAMDVMSDGQQWIDTHVPLFATRIALCLPAVGPLECSACGQWPVFGCPCCSICILCRMNLTTILAEKCAPYMLTDEPKFRDLETHPMHKSGE